MHRNNQHPQQRNRQDRTPCENASISPTGRLPLDLRPVGITREGIVVFDRPNSHHHLTRELLFEALSLVPTEGGRRPFVKETIDMGRIVGLTQCVATQPGDAIIFAKRVGRHGHSRFVWNRAPEPCASVVVILRRLEEGHGYLLITAFVGNAAEPEPWDRNATPGSVPFWNAHALVWGCEAVLEGTERGDNPWNPTNSYQACIL